MAGEDKKQDMLHTVIIDGREKLCISGVLDVQSFDEEQMIVETVRGILVVRGEGLHVEKLQLEVGELQVSGCVNQMEYDESVQTRNGFFGRLFGG